jgi:hypothetical protein
MPLLPISCGGAGETPHKKLDVFWNKRESLLLRTVKDLSYYELF